VRLLEKKIILEDLLNNNQITIDDTVVFGGYGHLISNSSELFTALDFLSQEAWNTLDFDPIETIISKYDATEARAISIDQGEYSILNTYVDQLNQKLPIYMGIIDTLTDDQESQDLNIKLSSEIATPQELAKLTNQLVNLSKVAKIDGEDIRFKGFDKGTDWITIGMTGYATYFLIMRCLKLAQEILKTQREYFKTRKAEIDYRASLDNQNDYSKKGQEAYEKRWIQVQKEQSVGEIASEVGKHNGFEENEIREHAQKTTDALINIIGDGNEVHLSLSPPKEVSEGSDGAINIDYSFLKKLDATKAVKELVLGDAKATAED